MMGTLVLFVHGDHCGLHSGDGLTVVLLAGKDVCGTDRQPPTGTQHSSLGEGHFVKTFEGSTPSRPEGRRRGVFAPGPDLFGGHPEE